MRNYIITGFLIILFSSCLFPKDDSGQSQRSFPLTLSFYTHSEGGGYRKFNISPINPGFLIGTEFYYKKGKFSKLFHTLNLGYYYNQYDTKAIFILTEFGYRHMLKFGLFGDILLGAGYLHSFYQGNIFKFNYSKVFEPVKNKGEPGLLYLAGLALGYDFSKKTTLPLSLFLKCHLGFQSQFKRDIKLFQYMLHLGLRINL